MTEKEEKENLTKPGHLSGKSYGLSAASGKLSVTPSASNLLHTPAPLQDGTESDQETVETFLLSSALSKQFFGMQSKKSVYLTEGNKKSLRGFFGEDSDKAISELMNGKGERIDLTASEMRMFLSLLVTLAERSGERGNPKSSDFYSGDGLIENPVEIKGGGSVAMSPRLTISGYDLAKIYTDKEKVSGKDIQNVKKIMESLSEKKFVVKTPIITGADRKGNPVFEQVAIRAGLVSVVRADRKTARFVKGEMVTNEGYHFSVDFHPVVRSHLAEGFSQFPKNVIKAAEDKSYLRFAMLLYMQYSINQKQGYFQIGETLFLRYVFPEEARLRKWKRIKEKMERYTDQLKQHGLLRDVTERQTKSGKVFEFIFNPDLRKRFQPT